MEGFEKIIESVIMIIPGTGVGGSAGGDHPLLDLFNAPNLVVISIKPQSKLCINLEVPIPY